MLLMGLEADGVTVQFIGQICLCVILSKYLALLPTPPEYLHFFKKCLL